MKRKDLIGIIEGMGCTFLRHGGKHDWYQNPLWKDQPLDYEKNKIPPEIPLSSA